MSFNSLHFLWFFPAVVLVYFILPKRIRYIWLLIASYYFYMCWSAKYALLLLFSTAVTYAFGLLMDACDRRGLRKDKADRLKKLCVVASLVLNLGVLIYFKYTNFALGALQRAFDAVHITLAVPKVDVLLPVGISFYIFQALSYTIDLYRREISVEKNFLRYALFVSFFPQLVAGPIERSKNLLSQLKEPKDFSFERFLNGLLLMLWGYFVKIVLADRISVFVDAVYADPVAYGGYYIAVASILFAFQIYCDFCGYSVIAAGAAEILGVKLMDNFNAPYLALSVSDFWTRWHISLSSWFRDYLYFPLGGSRKGKARTCLNKMIVFTLSGLWHGAQFSYVVWGMLNGLYQVISDLLKPVRDRAVRIFHIDRRSFCHRLVCMAGTFLLVDFALIFFRAEKLTAALQLIGQMFSVRNPWILFDGSLYALGLDRPNFTVMLLGIALLQFADAQKLRGVVIRERIMAQAAWFRVLFFAFSIFLLLLFGIYGTKYIAANFIYFQF